MLSPYSKPCSGVETWLLRLQPLTFKVKRIPGSKNITDALSRLVMPDSELDPDTEK